MHLQMSDSQVGERSVVTVAGEVDVASGPLLREHLLGLITDGHTQIVVDASAVSFMDSTGLGVVVGALKRLRQVGGDLVVVCNTEPVRKILRITGLLDVFKVAESIDDLPAAP